MFAHAFESAKPATNVGANMHPLGNMQCGMVIPFSVGCYTDKACPSLSQRLHCERPSKDMVKVGLAFFIPKRPLAHN